MTSAGFDVTAGSSARFARIVQTKYREFGKEELKGQTGFLVSKSQTLLSAPPDDDDVLPDVSVDGDTLLLIISSTFMSANVTRKTEFSFKYSVTDSAVKLPATIICTTSGPSRLRTGAISY